MPYISKETLTNSLMQLKGTAHHFMKIWFVLKRMGLKKGVTVEVDTSNSTDVLKRLYSYGEKSGEFFVPFAHTTRFMTMKHDAARSIIQTTLNRWATSGSVVDCNPNGYLDFSLSESGKVLVSQGRLYPMGLGNGLDGFALKEDTRVVIPDLSFAVWLFIRENIAEENPKTDLLDRMTQFLNLERSEYELVFIKDNLDVKLQNDALSEADIFDVCREIIESKNIPVKEIREDEKQYDRRIKNMITIKDEPSWLQVDPSEQLQELISSGEKAILIYGPPRTGKTRIIDNIFPKDSEDRVTIQIHEGWSYENLIIGLQPLPNSEEFDWKLGPLGEAIRDQKKCIVLEEINRTRISQALGEVFSLIEASYRGEENGIKLPNGKKIWINKDVQFIFTMNTIDESTEDIDDALLGRIASVEFPPRVEDLTELLSSKQIDEEMSLKIKDIYNTILTQYPLGHGYFAGITKETNFISYYVSRIRPTLLNHFQSARKDIVDQIDNAVDGVFIN
ncbi:AAA family ATPase [Virgibacillus halodenitrificans]|uniref:AAA family ATPase n=1 Tax=Virgibacillus halodenitrificans TaxID=1482 RepID=UPI00076123BC